MMTNNLKEEKEKIGGRIRYCRDKAGLSQEELAEAINLTPHQLSKIECGKCLIKVTNLKKVADALDVSMDFLTCRTDVEGISEWQWEESVAKLSDTENMLVRQILKEILQLTSIKNDGNDK